MSESPSDKQAIPTHSHVPVDTDNSLYDSVHHIKQRQVLSPVSPKPLYIATPSTIPVLKNQMDPTFNSTEAHNVPSGIELDPPYDPEQLPEVTNQNQVEEHQQQQQNGCDSQSEAQQHSQAFTMAPYDSEPGTIFTAPSYPPMDVSVGNVPTSSTGNGTSVTTTISSSMSGGTEGSSGGTENSNGAALPNLSKVVDLQQLLSTISQQQQPPLLSPSFTTAIQAQTGSSSAPTQNIANAAQNPSSQSPVESQRQPPASATPSVVHQSPSTISNGAFPRQPIIVSSSIPGNPPSKAPPSLPPPPKFDTQKKNSVAAAESIASEEAEDIPFTTEEEEIYSTFLNDERDYVTQGQWDRFPIGSRLFIGNLPTEKVTKRDLFRLFHRHGRLAQISIKQAYGFVQFLDVESCASALRQEQGAIVRGRKMHLEVSKPQRNSRNATDGARRRSRSPDYGRGSPRHERGGSYGGSGAGRGAREIDRFRGDRRDSRDHGRRRSPTPPRYRGRDDYRPPPRGRSRSRSPPRGYRRRTPTPELEDVPLPRRAPEQVPEVQIIVSDGDDLDRNFIMWIENAFRHRQLTCDLLFLSPRLQLSAVVKRQAIEGVLCVVFLSLQMQNVSKCTIQIFDRRGPGEASFDQYDNLEPHIAAELVVRSKLAHAPAIQAPLVSYGSGSYGQVPPTQAAIPHQFPAAQALPNLGSLINNFPNVDANTLHTLIAALQKQQQPQQQPQQASSLDIAALLANSRQAQQQPYGAQPVGSPVTPQSATFAQNPTLAALIQRTQSQQQAPQQAQQQNRQAAGQGSIGNIMETLAKWKPT